MGGEPAGRRPLGAMTRASSSVSAPSPRGRCAAPWGRHSDAHPDAQRGAHRNAPPGASRPEGLHCRQALGRSSPPPRHQARSTPGRMSLQGRAIPIGAHRLASVLPAGAGDRGWLPQRSPRRSRSVIRVGVFTCGLLHYLAGRESEHGGRAGTPFSPDAGFGNPLPIIAVFAPFREKCAPRGRILKAVPLAASLGRGGPGLGVLPHEGRRPVNAEEERRGALARGCFSSRRSTAAKPIGTRALRQGFLRKNGSPVP